MSINPTNNSNFSNHNNENTPLNIGTQSDSQSGSQQIQNQTDTRLANLTLPTNLHSYLPPLHNPFVQPTIPNNRSINHLHPYSFNHPQVGQNNPQIASSSSNIDSGNDFYTQLSNPNNHLSLSNNNFGSDSLAPSGISAIDWSSLPPFLLNPQGRIVQQFVQSSAPFSSSEDLSNLTSTHSFSNDVALSNFDRVSHSNANPSHSNANLIYPHANESESHSSAPKYNADNPPWAPRPSTPSTPSTKQYFRTNFLLQPQKNF